eukprot:3730434-Prymnesium_polylepis.2
MLKPLPGRPAPFVAHTDTAPKRLAERKRSARTPSQLGKLHAVLSFRLDSPRRQPLQVRV